MRSFKKSCLTNCDKILRLSSFEYGETDIQWNILHGMWNIFSLLLINDMSAYCEM